MKGSGGTLMRLVWFHVYAVSTFVITLAALAAAEGSFQSTKGPNKMDRKLFETNMCMAKGGLGIVTKDVYIVLTSKKNELILEEGKHWSGLRVPSAEIIVVFNG